MSVVFELIKIILNIESSIYILLQRMVELASVRHRTWHSDDRTLKNVCQYINMNDQYHWSINHRRHVAFVCRCYRRLVVCGVLHCICGSDGLHCKQMDDISGIAQYCFICSENFHYDVIPSHSPNLCTFAAIDRT